MGGENEVKDGEWGNEGEDNAGREQNKMKREQNNSREGVKEGENCVLDKAGMFCILEKWQVDSVAEILIDFPKVSRP